MREGCVDLIVAEQDRSGERVLIERFGLLARQSLSAARVFFVEAIEDVGRDADERDRRHDNRDHQENRKDQEDDEDPAEFFA